MRGLKYLLLALAFVAQVVRAAPAPFPDHALTIVVPFGPGSGADIAARFFGQQLSQSFKQAVIVLNRPGGSGAVAVGAIKAAPADGYTILLAGNSPVTVNTVVMKDLSYDPVKDLRPVAGLIRSNSVIVVGVDSPYKTLADLVNAARSAKMPLTAGTSSAGYYLTGAWFSNFAGFKFSNVAYNSVPQSILDLSANRLDFAVSDMTGSIPLIKGGKIRALAILGATRHVDFPDLPTVAESGYPGCVSYMWNSFYINAATPDNVTNILASTMQKILATDASRQFARRVGVELMPLGPDALRKLQLDDIAKFKRIADQQGLKPQ